jgi:hypothetical protein
MQVAQNGKMQKSGQRKRRRKSRTPMRRRMILLKRLQRLRLRLREEPLWVAPSAQCHHLGQQPSALGLLRQMLL